MLDLKNNPNLEIFRDQNKAKQKQKTKQKRNKNKKQNKTKQNKTKQKTKKQRNKQNVFLVHLQLHALHFSEASIKRKKVGPRNSQNQAKSL